MVTIGLGRLIWHNLDKVTKAERLVRVTNFTVVHLHKMQEWDGYFAEEQVM